MIPEGKEQVSHLIDDEEAPTQDEQSLIDTPHQGVPAEISKQVKTEVSPTRIPIPVRRSSRQVQPPSWLKVYDK